MQQLTMALCSKLLNFVHKLWFIFVFYISENLIQTHKTLIKRHDFSNFLSAYWMGVLLILYSTYLWYKRYYNFWAIFQNSDHCAWVIQPKVVASSPFSKPFLPFEGTTLSLVSSKNRVRAKSFYRSHAGRCLQ